MKALVTGASGFIGRALAEGLLREGWDLRVLARDPGRLGGLAPTEAVGGDVADPAAVERAVAGVEVVFHLAGAFREPGLPDARYREVNVGGVRHVIEAARRHGVRRLVHASTVGVHGRVTGTPLHEDSPLRPDGIYEATKAEGDALALAEAAAGRPEVVVLRPTPVYGPGDTRLLKLFRLALRPRPLMVGDGTPRYHMVYVDDLVDAFLLAASRPEAPGQAFIVGSGQWPSLDELVAAIAHVAGRPTPEVVYLPAGPVRLLAHACELACRPLGISPPLYRRRVDFFLLDRRYDTGKAERLLGFRPRVGLEEGLARTLAWYRSRGMLGA